MSPKSLVAAKALGGGILGGGSIVGAGYGVTKYFKSEEVDVSPTTPITSQEVHPVQGTITSNPESERNGEQDTEENIHTDSSMKRTEERREDNPQTSLPSDVPAVVPAQDGLPSAPGTKETGPSISATEKDAAGLSEGSINQGEKSNTVISPVTDDVQDPSSNEHISGSNPKAKRAEEPSLDK